LILFGFPFSLTAQVCPDKFLKLWPIYWASFLKAPPLADGNKPNKLIDLPAIQAIAACRDQMASMGLNAMTAPAYGSRLSLVCSVLTEPILSEQFSAWIHPSHEGLPQQPQEKLLICMAQVNIKNKFPIGVMIDVNDLKERLNA
jgi:hypothetical protein